MKGDSLKIIAECKNGFDENFGIPRQSGLVKEAVSKIVFLPEYSDENCLRGIEDYSHIWLIWGFSKATKTSWSPTVRPPRLGGNKRMGVFATRSPYRPNKIGLSSVKLLSVAKENGQTVLYVAGADLLNSTPIYDIKPYLSFTDSHPEAVGGFAEKVKDYSLAIEIPEQFNLTHKAEIIGILSNDPRPSYIENDDRVYGVCYYGQNIKFKVNGNRLTVIDVK